MRYGLDGSKGISSLMSVLVDAVFRWNWFGGVWLSDGGTVCEGGVDVCWIFQWCICSGL